MAIRIIHSDTESGIKIVEDAVKEPEVDEGEEVKEVEERPDAVRWVQFEISEANPDIAEKLGGTSLMPMPKAIRILKDLRKEGVLLSIDTEMLISAEDRKLMIETMDSYIDENN